MFAAFQALDRGEPVRLPAKSTSFKHWAERLAAYGQSAEAEQELAWWQGRPWSQAARLPVDYPQINRAVAIRAVSVGLDLEDTEALLRKVPGVYHTEINDVLLTALVDAFAEWTGRRTLLVALEGHGREDMFAGLDLSRSVGWFTSLFPVLLELTTATDPGSALKSVKEQLRAIPGRGMGYGILRYLRRDSLPKLDPEISFNYLGQLDSEQLDLPFRFADEDVGDLQGADNQRRHLIDISARVSEGRLQVQWFYNAALHKADTIDALAKRYMSCLRDLIAHCRSSAGGHTPSDFLLAGLDQPQLDRLMDAVGGAGPVEDVYPLTPLQHGLLFHSLYEPLSTVYVTTLTCRLAGPLDVEAFETAWASVVERHAVLRSAFVGHELQTPLQVVLRRAALPVRQHDWRGMETAEQANQFAALVASAPALAAASRDAPAGAKLCTR